MPTPLGSDITIIVHNRGRKMANFVAAANYFRDFRFESSPPRQGNEFRQDKFAPFPRGQKGARYSRTQTTMVVLENVPYLRGLVRHKGFCEPAYIFPLLFRCSGNGCVSFLRGRGKW